MLQIQPISYREACDFINRYHRHHTAPQGWKFGIAVNDGEKVVGVATIGRPVARMYDDSWTLEVTRLCTDGTKDACSKLYSAAWRACRDMGYHRLITYTLTSESGSSLRAAGWRVVHQTQGGSWSRKRRLRVDKAPTCQKTLWEVR